jgi:hypothetical protein
MREFMIRIKYVFLLVGMTMLISGVAGVTYSHLILRLDLLPSVYGYSAFLVLGICCLLLSYRRAKNN